MKENAVDMSTLSRSELVGELLAHDRRYLPDEIAGERLHVADGEPFHGPVIAQQTLLDQKLSVARELILRDLQTRMRGAPVMNSPQTLREWLRLYCASLEHEVFLALYLDAHHALIGTEQLFRGTLTQTSVYPRELVKAALARNAAAVAVAHNHPSGSAEPSRADEFLTQTLKSALGLVDVRFLDHFIVAGDNVVSFAERGLV
ncbi:MAG: DNA repair protein RadC [Leptothrix sp. (in: Bacteria)]|nr:DNA repair protein RadC [Leptothrix sp. (in: b-proteobacteria)]